VWKQLVYFGVNSKYLVDYSSPKSRGERHMFLCRVLLGPLLVSVADI
jgi:hypothetical protein